MKAIKQAVEVPFKVTDMIRATVILYSINELQDVYSELLKIPALDVMKVKNKLDTELENITVLFVFKEAIVGEV